VTRPGAGVRWDNVTVVVDVALKPRNRLFAALDLPEELREELAARAGALAAELGGRAVPAANLHLTLAFLGQVRAERGAAVVGALREALLPPTALPPLRVRLGPLTPRPSRGRARLLAADLIEPSGELEALGLRVQRAFAELGFAVDVRERFWPHVTVVRFARPAAVGRPAWADDERQFDVSRATIYDSLLSPGGPPRYEALWRADLAIPQAITHSA
jgi:RNA 2',3'-cyclic 3'-phosphodiesterase